MASLTQKEVRKRSKAILKDNSLGDIYKDHKKRGRGHEIEEFVETRVRELFPPKGGETEEKLTLTILNELRGVELAIENILQQYDFSRHVNLDNIENVGPKARYYKERRGWGRRDRVFPKNNPQGRREQLVRSIIWRAVTLHKDEQLWKLDKLIELQVLLDRRLHMVELMRYHVSKAGEITRWSQRKGKITRTPNRNWRLTITGNPSTDPTPKWTDGHVLRWFEYPRVPNTAKFHQAIAAWLNHLYKFNPQLSDQEAANWEAQRLQKGRVIFNIPSDRVWLTRKSTKPANQASKYWQLDPDDNNHFRWILTKEGIDHPDAAIDFLFMPTQFGDPKQPYTRQNPDEGWKNWWERNHFYCDQTLHALMLKSLLLAMQNHAPNAKWFEKLLEDFGTKYIQIYVPSFDSKALGCDRSDLVFFNPEEASIEVLEIGDGIRVDNHPVYPHLTQDIWRLENAVVVDIKGPISSKSIWVEGHGTGARPLLELQNTVLRKLNEHIRGAQDLIRNRPKSKMSLSYDGGSYDGGGNLSVRPLVNEKNPERHLYNWGVIWRDAQTIWYNPKSGIIDTGRIHAGEKERFFPLWQRTSRGRLREVKVNINMVRSVFSYSKSSAITFFHVAPKIIKIIKEKKP